MEKSAVAVMILFHDVDTSIKEQIVKHLYILKRNGHIRLWQKGLVLAGENPEALTQGALEEAEIVLFLVSAESLSSDELWKEEVEHSLERQKRQELVFIPVIVRDCAWEQTVLRHFKPLPEGAKPLSSWLPLHLDIPCKQVADAVGEHVKKIKRQKQSENKQQGIVPPEFQEIDLIFQKMPDNKVMKHMSFADHEGKPASAVHFAIYAQILKDIEQRMRAREEYNFYVDNLCDAKEIEEIAKSIKERADLLKLDTIELGQICQELEDASQKFRDDFGIPEHASPSNWQKAKVRYVEPFCNAILKIEKKLDTLSRFSAIVDLSDLSPN